NFLPLGFQPFGYPQGKNFVYAYSQQANLTLERDLGNGLAFSLAYNFNGGRASGGPDVWNQSGQPELSHQPVHGGKFECVSTVWRDRRTTLCPSVVDEFLPSRRAESIHRRCRGRVPGTGAAD